MSLILASFILFVIAALASFIFKAQIYAYYKAGRCQVMIRFFIIILGFSCVFLLYTQNNSCNQFYMFSNNQSAKISVSSSISEPKRIACVVMTFHSRHSSLARSVKETWGRHCNVLLFFSDTQDSSIPTIKAPQADNQSRGPWIMTTFALRYVQKHYDTQIDWIYKCDDDTYAIVENMRDLVANISLDTPSYLGFHVKSPSWFMSGGAGYLINKATWHLILKQGLAGSYPSCTKNNMQPEDLIMGQCLKALGVNFTDTRDSQGRERFFTEPVGSHTYPYNNLSSYPFDWYTGYAYHPTNFGLNCCAEDPISFHHLQERHMYELEYLIYGIRHPRPQILLH